jgi:hypothetical protein
MLTQNLEEPEKCCNYSSDLSLIIFPVRRVFKGGPEGRLRGRRLDGRFLFAYGQETSKERKCFTLLIVGICHCYSSGNFE